MKEGSARKAVPEALVVVSNRRTRRSRMSRTLIATICTAFIGSVFPAVSALAYNADRAGYDTSYALVRQERATAKVTLSGTLSCTMPAENTGAACNLTIT